MVLSVSLSVALSASLSVSFSVALPVGWPIVDRYTRVCGVVAGEGQEGKTMGGEEKKRKKGQAAPKHFSIHDHIHTATRIKPSSCGAHRKVSRIQFCLHSSTTSKTPAIDKAPIPVKKRQHLRQGTKRRRPYIYIYTHWMCEHIVHTYTYIHPSVSKYTYMYTHFI